MDCPQYILGTGQFSLSTLHGAPSAVVASATAGGLRTGWDQRRHRDSHSRLRGPFLGVGAPSAAIVSATVGALRTSRDMETPRLTLATARSTLGWWSHLCCSCKCNCGWVANQLRQMEAPQLALPTARALLWHWSPLRHGCKWYSGCVADQSGQMQAPQLALATAWATPQW